MNVRQREYQKLYMDYWNSTAELTGTGRPVDGVVCPIAPYAAVIPCQYSHIGYSSFLNLVDYTGVAIPVTYADKRVDILETGLEFLSQDDREVQSQCEALFLERFPGGHLLIQPQTTLKFMTVLPSECSSLGDGSRKRRC